MPERKAAAAIELNSSNYSIKAVTEVSYASLSSWAFTLFHNEKFKNDFMHETLLVDLELCGAPSAVGAAILSSLGERGQQAGGRGRGPGA